MKNRKTPSSPNWALGDDDVALGETQAAPPPSDGARAVGSSNPSGADPLVGQVLEGKYEIVELVGEGGMGRVYKAKQLSTGRFVAVKILHERFGSAPAQAVRERFLAEVRMTAALNHSSIVTIHDAGETPEGVPYLIMEYLVGEDLATVLERENRFAPERVVEIMRQVCDALHAAHERGVVHRDLKPGNIFLVRGSGDTEIVKVVDFGVAKASEELLGNDRLTLAGQTLGTPDYMAPEQARGEEVDRRTDIYAAGIIAYEMLTGRRPHEAAVGPGATPIKVLHVKGENTVPTPVTQYRKDLPPALAAAVMRALRNDADNRPQTMAQLAHELRAAMAAPSRGTTTSKAAAQVRKPFPRFGVGVAAVALLAVVVGFITAQSGKPAPVRSGESQSGKESETAIAPAVVEPITPASRSAAVPTPPPVATVPQDKPATPPSGKPAPAISPPAGGGVRGGAKGAYTPPPTRRKVAPSVARVRETRRRDEVRKTKVAELRKAAQDTRVALRRNPRNRELRARLNGVCRELTELGEQIPECQ